MSFFFIVLQYESESPTFFFRHDGKTYPTRSSSAEVDEVAGDPEEADSEDEEGGGFDDSEEDDGGFYGEEGEPGEGFSEEPEVARRGADEDVDGVMHTTVLITQEESSVDSVSRNDNWHKKYTYQLEQNNKVTENGSENNDSVNTSINLGEGSTSFNLNVVNHAMGAENSSEIAEELGRPKRKRVPRQLGVVPTTYMIRARQTPAWRFASCQGFL